MKKSLVLIWILSVAIAFIIGNQTKALFQKIQPQSDIAQVDKFVVKQSNLSTAEQKIIRRTSAIVENKSSSDNNNDQTIDEVVAELKTLLSDGFMSFNLPALAESYNLIKDLSEQEIVTALGLIDLNSGNPENMMLLSTMIGRYAELNPEASLIFINENITLNQTKQMAVNTVITYWANSDPVAAYYWSNSDDNSELSDSSNSISFGMMAIFNGLAKRDLYDAIDKLSEVENSGKNLQMAAIGITQAIEFKNDFIDFITLADEMGNETIKDTAIRSWASKDPQEAADWIFSAGDQTDNRRMQSTVLSTWLSKHPKDAADWYMGLPNETTNQVKLNKIVSQWSYQSPKDALEWINEQSDIDYDKTIMTLLTSSASTNSRFAMNNLNLLSSDTDKQNLSYRIYNSLNYSNKKQAAEFLAKSPFKVQLEQKISDAKQIRAKRKAR